MSAIIMIGLPGSGKTTVCSEVEDILKNAGKSVTNKIDCDYFIENSSSKYFFKELFIISKYGFHTWIFFIRSLIAIKLSGHSWRASLKNSIIFSLMRIFLLENNREGNTVIMDQCFETPLCFLASQANKPQKLTRNSGLLKSFYKGISYRIVFFSIDIEVAIQRLLKSTDRRWWTKGREETEIIEQLAKRQKQYLDLGLTLKNAIPIAEMNGEMGVDEKVDRISGLINSEVRAIY